MPVKYHEFANETNEPKVFHQPTNLTILSPIQPRTHVGTSIIEKPAELAYSKGWTK